jgi:hypothetical protein
MKEKDGYAINIHSVVLDAVCTMWIVCTGRSL